MSSRKKKQQGFQNKPSVNPVIERMQAEKAAREEEQLLADERVKAKIEELDQKIKETETSLTQRKEKLDAEYKEKNDALEADKADLVQRMAELSKREDAVLDMETALEAEKTQVREAAIAEVKADERCIREGEYKALRAAWEAEAESQRAALSDELKAQRTATADELQKAHDLRVAAETECLERVHSADKDIQERYAQLMSEYQAKLKELNSALVDYQRKKAEYDMELEELEGDRVYVQELKKRYEGCSEVEVKRLQLKIEHLEQINLASQERISEQSKKIARLEVRALDTSGQSALERIDELETRLATATEQLDEYSNLPSPSRIAELQHCEEMLQTQRMELDETKTQLVTAQAQLSAYALDKRELENARTTAAALQSLNEQLQKKLQYITEQYKSTHESKFQGLLEIDGEKYIPSERPAFKGTLAELVEYIRNYGATQRTTKLYYSAETIRVFIASLAAAEPASRLLILQGLSGTGKSSLPELFKNALDIRWHSISVQPSWRDNRELLGYDNDFTNRFKETEFTKALYKASMGDYKDDIVFIVLDEMNLARIEYYFADFLSELEHRDAEWKIPLISSFDEPNKDQRPLWLNYDNGTANIMVTKNIWFIGTANNDDSTSLITDKVYDRAQILDMDEREKDFVGENVKPVVLDFPTLTGLFEKARKTKAYQMTPDDWATLNDIDETNLRPMDITFGNRMKNQLADFVPVYVACGGTKEGAIDYFLAHKILRKLDEKYDAYVADCLEDLIEALNTYYGEGVFEKSLKKIETIKKRNFSTGDN
ncbi:hypothetical protein ACQRDF_10190 [Lachnospiraceae bacterium SGI.054]